ncbi:hypothetical protein RUND412_009505 [Rhizina undulata]
MPSFHPFSHRGESSSSSSSSESSDTDSSIHKTARDSTYTRRHKHRHRHPHLPHHRHKDYSVMPMGGNRPLSIPGLPTATTEVSTAITSVNISSPTVPQKPERYDSKSSNSSRKSPTVPQKPKRHDSTSSSSSRKSSQMRRSSTAPVTAPAPMEAPRTEQKATASVGIAINNGRRRRGTDESGSPPITLTPPTPSPLEHIRRRHTNSLSAVSAPSFPSAPTSYPRNAPPPYPVTPPTIHQDSGDYIAYRPPPSSIPMEKSDSMSSYVSVSSHGHESAVEIGSSESIPQPVVTKPRRSDSGKSFASRTATTRSRRSGPSSENQYEFLRNFDTVFVIDDSASMATNNRWDETREALETIASIATTYDTDGIDIHFLNSRTFDAHNVTSPAIVRQVFSQITPHGCTPTAECLDLILRSYLDRYILSRRISNASANPTMPGIKPLNIVVLTDGEPTDDPESVIVDVARKLDRLNAPLGQVGIQFFQIGDDEESTRALEDLDDRLEGVYGVRDMVDTTPWRGGKVRGEDILKCLVGAVNRRIDRWGNG